MRLTSLPAAWRDRVHGEVPPPATKRVRRVRVIALPDPQTPGAERFTIRIERWHPTRLNELLGHPMHRARQKKADAQLIAYSCREAGVTRATVPRVVTVTIVLAPRQRAGDPDAYWKSLLDALAHADAIVDDNRQWCRPMPVQFARAADIARVSPKRVRNLMTAGVLKEGVHFVRPRGLAPRFRSAAFMAWLDPPTDADASEAIPMARRNKPRVVPLARAAV